MAPKLAARSLPFVFMVGLTVGCSALGFAEPDGSTGISGRIDERAGSFHGVAIGDTANMIQSHFGHKAPADRTREPVIPANQSIEDFRGPTGFRLGDHWYRYDGASVFYDSAGVHGFMVTSRGSKTSRGVGIGDSLAEVRTRYPELRCGVANKSTDYHQYPACTGELESRRYIWFGGDPISNITLGDRRLDSVS
jgi:hypothetical protein